MVHFHGNNFVVDDPLPYTLTLNSHAFNFVARNEYENFPIYCTSFIRPFLCRADETRILHVWPYHIAGNLREFHGYLFCPLVIIGDWLTTGFLSVAVAVNALIGTV